MIEGVDTSPLGELDVGIERDTRHAKPCCKRLSFGWCFLGDPHAGDCLGPPARELEPNDFGPRKVTR